MVIKKSITMLVLFFLFPILLLAQQNSSITAEIENGEHIEYQSLKGLITITHDKKDKVDPSSFVLSGQPLSVELQQEVSVAPGSPLVVSFYRFTLPGQMKGLHALSPISVKVGDQTLTSIASTFVVGETTTGTPVANVTLKFENIVEGNQTLYPGEHIRLGYRYTYSGMIELTNESLPLLDVKELTKIGPKSIKNFTQGQLNIREIIQEYQTTTPGTLTLGPSAILGYAYTEQYGRKQYLKPALQSGAPEVKLTVNNFPTEGKPPSFNGAIGPFDHFSAQLLSDPKINVGDKILLSLSIGGKGSLSSVTLPPLCCEPGFSGLFQQSDLPPTQQMKGQDTKQFNVEMRVLSASVKQIPSIEFAYFDPLLKSYETLHSQPIPIAVTPLQNKPVAAPAPPPKEAVDTTASHGNVAKHLVPIEIKTIKPLTPSDLNNPFFRSWGVFWIIPLGLALLLLQLDFYWSRKEKGVQVKSKDAEEYFKEAMQLAPNQPDFFRLLQQALLLRLKEKGHIAAIPDTVNALPSDGITGTIRAFLLRIDELRFTGHDKDLERSILEEAKQLFEEI